jgi:hypothetical protein
MLKELLVAFGILSICVVLHVLGIVFVGDQMVSRQQAIAQRARRGFVSAILMAVFSFVILLHLVEACIWAAFYRWQGLFPTFETALYFSLKSYSTVGYGDVLLPPSWRLLGTVEAISGVLLCGLSAAFLFTIIHALFRFRIQQLDEQKTPEVVALRASR